MNPIRTGRAIIFVLPYIMLFAGILAAAKVASAPGGTEPAFQALGVAAIGGVWAWFRARQSHR